MFGTSRYSSWQRLSMMALHARPSQPWHAGAALTALLASVMVLVLVLDRSLLPASIGFTAALCALIATIVWPEIGAMALLLILFTRVSDLPSFSTWPVSLTQGAVAVTVGGMLIGRLIVRHER